MHTAKVYSKVASYGTGFGFAVVFSYATHSSNLRIDWQ